MCSVEWRGGREDGMSCVATLSPQDQPHEAEGPTDPMSRASQISDRKRIEAFFREVFRDEAGIAAGAAGTLAESCARRIKRVVVWDDAAAADSAEVPLAAAQALTPQNTATPQNDAPMTPAAPVLPAEAPTAHEPAPPMVAAAFDPYAFSAVVVLTKTGKDGLLKRLAAIDRPEHLKKLAEAQHLAVDASLSSIAELRAAIVKAAEGRIANRRAAAS